MMARDQGKVRTMQITPGQALALQLGARAAAAAGEAARIGGYTLTPEQVQRINHELALEALAAGTALAEAVAAGMPAPSDDVLDEAADRSGAAKVVEVCGRPPAAN
jgi:hypothetical protein